MEKKRFITPLPEEIQTQVKRQRERKRGRKCQRHELQQNVRLCLIGIMLLLQLVIIRSCQVCQNYRSWKKPLLNITSLSSGVSIENINIRIAWGGSPGLVVMGRDSCSEGRGFESRCRILDGHFITLICCKIVLMFL